MNDLKSYPFLRPGRYSSKNMLKPITFICMEQQAKHVSLIGEFNHWNPNVHPMKQQVDKTWQIQVPLSHGHHHYAFYVDGELKLDPRATGTVLTEENEKVSMLSVS